MYEVEADTFKDAIIQLIKEKKSLRYADFTGTNLRGADFRGASLKDADFRDADLKGAIFEQKQNIPIRKEQTNASIINILYFHITTNNIPNKAVQKKQIKPNKN